MSLHPQSCTCCADLLATRMTPRMSRRGFLGAAAASAALLPGLARAGSGNYQALLLTCIDPRMPEKTLAYMRERHLLGQYSQMAIAGAGIAVVAPAFEKWRPAFWENLAASIQLHHIPKVIVLDHRDCGASAIAFGKDAVATPEKETATHKAALDAFRAQVAARHPGLGVEAGLMALDGSVQML